MPRFPFLDESDKSRSPSISNSLSCNLYAELSPESAKSQIALIGRPGLALSITASGISRGVYVFSGLQYHVIGNKIWSYDGNATLVNLSSTYSFPNLQTTTGPIQFTDNGIAPAGGGQILFSDGTYAYVLDIDPQPTITIVGDGSGAGFDKPVFTNGVLTALGLPAGSNNVTGTGSGYFSAVVSIIGGNPTSPAVVTATLGGGPLKSIFVTNTGSGYYSGVSGTTVVISPPDIPVTTYSSALTIGTGNFSITLLTGLNFLPTEPITVYNSATEYMTGTVTSYNSITGALVFNITAVVGSGSYSSWKIYQTSQIATATIDASSLVGGQIIGVRITNFGSGYVNQPTVTISGGNPVVAAVLVASTTGSPIVGYVISNGGAGYGRPHLQQLLVSGPNYPTDSPAATAFLSTKTLTNINLGSTAYVGYSGAPSCTITGGGGIGAAAVTVVNAPSNNAYANLTVVGGHVTAATFAANPAAFALDPNTTQGFGGAGYSTLPILTVYDALGTGAGAVLQPIMGGVVSGVDLSSTGVYPYAGRGGIYAPQIIFTGGGYTRVAAAHPIMVIGRDNQINAVGSVIMDDEGAGYTSAPSITFTTSPLATPSSPFEPARGTARLTSGLSSIQVVNQGSNYSSTGANVIISNAITSIEIAAGGSGFTSAPTIAIGGSISSITITNGGSGYNNAPLNPPGVSVNGTFTTRCQTRVVVVGGVVVNIIILDPGLNYTGSATVSIDPPPSGTTATATATISAATATAVVQSGINYVTVTSGGAHLTDVPTITITDPTGTGAALEANIEDGQLVSIAVISSGTNYTGPVLSFSGGAGLSNGNGILSSVNTVNGVGIIGYGNGSTVFQTSAKNDFTQWSALDFASKDVNSDPLVSVGQGSINGYMGLFGQLTTELWSISASNTPPFVYSSLINSGLAAQASLVMMDNTFYWLANTNNNGKAEFIGIVRFMGSGSEVISTTDINYEIQQMATISDAVAYSYTDSGHTFYIITFPTGNKTYGFDISTKKWHRRSYWTGNYYTYGRELVQNYIHFNGKHYATDYNSGNIYTFADVQYSDNGAPIARLRIGPPLFDKDNLKSLIFDLIEIDMTTNVGGTGAVAAATCTQLSGVIQSPITMTNAGAIGGYIIPPTVIMLDANGTGASMTAVLNGSGQVASITLNAGGTGYTSPLILILGGYNNPTAILSFSDDDVTTWSGNYMVTIGNSSWGAQLRGVWRQMGQSRKRTLRLVIVDPISTTLVAGYISARALNV